MAPVDALLADAALVCDEIAASESETDELRERRGKLWLEANGAGASFPVIAEACGVSPQLVNREIQRQRKKSWAAPAAHAARMRRQRGKAKAG